MASQEPIHTAYKPPLIERITDEPRQHELSEGEPYEKITDELQRHGPTEGEPYGKPKKYAALKTRLICGGLIGAGLVILQAFISAGVFVSMRSPSTAKVLSWPALISVISLALSLPLLSALLLLTFEETSRKYIVKSKWSLRLLYWVGAVSALIGIVAAFWYIQPAMGILTAISTGFATAVYTHYSRRLTQLDKQLKARWKFKNIYSEEDELS